MITKARAKDDRQRASLQSRVSALGDAASLSEGRGDAVVVGEAQRVVRQVDQRLAFSGDDTVIALAGATGSGKSSVFNAIAGRQLAEPGLKRPTTSKALAAYWGTAPPSDLLDWLDVPRRQIVDDGDSALAGLVLIDLPDHDSLETSHRLEVDRLVQLVDCLIWVVDPQKYADNALHERYLRPLADHAEVMMVVLNQADRLTPDQLDKTMLDLRRLLRSEGLGEVPVLAVSALTGLNVDKLRAAVKKLVADKAAASARLSLDVATAARSLDADLGDGQVGDISVTLQQRLADAFAEAAGVPQVSEAVLKSMRHRGVGATGWPLVNWLTKLRPDPLRMLHLDRGVAKKTERPGQNQLEPVAVQRTSLRVGGGVQQARVDAAVRDLVEDASAGMPSGWADAVRQAARTDRERLADDLDQAVATTDLRMNQGHGWWKLVRVLQWLLIVVVIAGLAWLFSGVILAYFQLPPLEIFRWRNIPLPTLMVFGGLAVGVLLAGLSRIGVEVGARHKAAQAETAMTRAVTGVALEAVIKPVNLELQRYSKAQELVAKAVR